MLSFDGKICCENFVAVAFVAACIANWAAAAAADNADQNTNHAVAADVAADVAPCPFVAVVAAGIAE